MSRGIRTAVLGLLGLCVLAPLTWAQSDDSRLRISIPHEDTQGTQPDMGQTMRQALPMLWDRLVPRQSRMQADSIAPDYRLVARIVPGKEQTTVEFNGKAVFQTLKEQHIASIILTPRFHLVIQMHNSAGFAMPETQLQLMNEAQRIASGWGIELAADAPGLVAAWQWLDDRNLMLSVRGNTRLQEFSETRSIADADPLPALREWLKDVLLKARDAYAFDANEPLDTTTATIVESEERVQLTVDRPSRLLEQVALEEALKNDPRIRGILPVSLSKTRQRYLLKLEGTDDSWLPDWFARRGYRLAALPEGGWLAQ